MLADHLIEEHDKAKRQSQEAATKRQEDGLAKAMPHLDRLTHHLQRIEDAAVQAELDQLTKKLLALTQGGVYQKWGYIPSREGHHYTLVTTMFFHGGFMHLFGNMLLFFLCGPFVEDRWGRTLFMLFYLASGIVATWCHGFWTDLPDVPLIGCIRSHRRGHRRFSDSLLSYKNQVPLRHLCWLAIVQRTFSNSILCGATPLVCPTILQRDNPHKFPSCLLGACWRVCIRLYDGNSHKTHFFGRAIYLSKY